MSHQQSASASHDIKYNRAKKLAAVGENLRTFDALWRALPTSLVETLTGAELAVVVDLMRAQHQRGESIGWNDACETFRD